MKSLVRLLLVTISVAALGCGAQAQAPPRDVCPVIRQGDRWVYDMIGTPGGGSLASGLRTRLEITAVGKRTLEGREVDVFRTATGIYEFVARDATGCFTVAMQKPGDVAPVPERPLRYAVKYPLQVGTTWTVPYRTQLLLFDDYSLQLTRRIVSLNETVTVPAGTFSAVRVTASGSQIIDRGNLMGKVEIKAEHHVWHAPGVGMVKAILKEADHRPGDPKASSSWKDSVTLELVSHSAAPK